MGAKKYTAVSLFCGCGGLDLGAERAGFRVLGAFDADPDAVASFNRNLRSKANLVDVTGIDPKVLPEGVDLIMGGPPCQGFSSAGNKRRDDPRNRLWHSYAEVLHGIQPKFFILENVRGFLKEAAGDFRQEISRRLGSRYRVESKLINMQFYGVPQRRIRAFVFGARNDIKGPMPWPKPEAEEYGAERRGHPCLISMRQALEDLGPAEASEDKKAKCSGLDHVYLPLEAKHLDIAIHVPNGGALKDIPEASLPNVYRGRKRGIDKRGKFPGWFYYYRKPDPELPGRTVLATLGPTFAEIIAPDVWMESSAGRNTWVPVNPQEYTDRNGLYTSPVPQRRLTVRECARLQTFPDEFVFSGDLLSRYRQIGNAVPCEFSFRLCASIVAALNGSYSRVGQQELSFV